MHTIRRLPSAAFSSFFSKRNPDAVCARVDWRPLACSFLVIAGLCSCDSQTKASATTAPSTANVVVPEGFSGKWAARTLDGTKRKSRTIELGRDGRYVECYEEVLFGGTGQRVFDTSLCQQGNWSDLGTAGSIHQDLRFVARDRFDLVPLTAGAHLIELDPVDFDSAIARELHRADGLVLTRIGDSLVYLGDFLVFRGGRGRLDSTLWRRPGSFMDGLFLRSDSTASATVNGVQLVSGKWSIDFTSTLLVEFHLPNQVSVLQGVWGFHSEKLIVTDFEDPGSFGWEGPAGI